jgi:hypothetical protein
MTGSIYNNLKCFCNNIFYLVKATFVITMFFLPFTFDLVVLRRLVLLLRHLPTQEPAIPTMPSFRLEHEK